MKSIKTEIIINAPVEKVWQTLMDFENHPNWNPFIKSITGSTNVGDSLKVFIQPPNGNGMTFKPIVMANIPNKEFRWKGKLFVKGIFDGEHYFMVDEIDHSTTLFTHGENFSGVLVALMGGMLDKTKEGFEIMNEAIKKQCER